MYGWKAILSKFRPKSLQAEPLIDSRIAVVKSRPLSLRERYCHLAKDDQVEAFFGRLQHRIYREVDRYNSLVTIAQRVQGRILRETGRLAMQRPYFFVQPINESGWLFERDAHGWRITRAQKLVGQQTFMREYANWDVVTLHTSDALNGPPRVDSQRFKADLVSYAVYEQQLLHELGLKAEPK